MLEKLKNLLSKWQVQVLLVGGAVVVATTFGTCTFEPAVSVDDATDAEEATTVEGAVNAEGTATTEEATTGEATGEETTVG